LAKLVDIFAGWKNQYGGRDNCIYITNDGIAFAMTGSKEGKNNNKKKEITCKKHNKMGKHLTYWAKRDQTS